MFGRARLPIVSSAHYWKALLSVVMIFTIMNSVYATTPTGTVIDNTAIASFDIGNGPLVAGSNTVSITTVRTPASMGLFQYNPGAPVLSEETPSLCRNGSGGAFAVSADPVVNVIGGGALALNPGNPVGLSPAAIFHGGNPIFIRVDDADQNRDANLSEAIEVRVVSTLGDQEDVRLNETDVNTGVFIGYIQSTGNAVIPFNCQLSVAAESSVTVSYTDAFDGSDTVAVSTLVDPYGILFDSTSGDPIDGIVITLLDADTGQPAIPGVQVFGDDGISAYPNTIVSGSSATDSGGNVVIFPRGGYRFPLILPGRYRLQISVAPGYLAPSQTSIVNLQNLPSAPFALFLDASFGLAFVLNPGPPLHVDIPIDPVTVQLVVDKTVSKRDAGIGDFVEYRVNVQNTDAVANARDVVITDVLPQGFRYQLGSARLDGGLITDPVTVGDGRTLQFTTRDLLPNAQLSIRYVAEITAGTPTGNAVNRARASDSLGAASNVAQAVIEVRDEFMREHVTVVGRVIVGNCPQLPPGEGQAGIRLRAERKDKFIAYTLDIGVDTVPVSNYRLSLVLPDAVHYLPGSSRLDQLVISDPQVDNHRLVFQLGGTQTHWPAGWQHQLRFDVELIENFSEQALETQAFSSMDTLYRQNQKTILAKVTLPAGVTDARLASVGITPMNGEVLKVDSGLLQQQVVGHIEERESAQVGTDLSGLQGARVFMENGAYGVTDTEGKYHFEGVLPGTHVIQLDESSLPPGMQVLHCEENTRFAGKAYSRFVDVQGGSLWRVDFHVQPKPPVLSDVTLEMSSSLQGRTVELKIEQSGGPVDLSNYRLTVLLPEGLSYIPASSAWDAQATDDPEINDTILVYRRGDFPGNWQHALTFKARLRETAAGELSIKAFSMFDTQAKGAQRVGPVENILRKREDRYADKQFVFQPRYASFKTELSDEDKAEIDFFLIGLDEAEIDNVRVVGHTDDVPISVANQSVFKDNYVLSEARANVVAEYVQNVLKLADSKIVAVGIGPDQPLADNTGAEGRARNRRTEIFINTVERTKIGEASVLQNKSGIEKVTVIGQSSTLKKTEGVMPPKVSKFTIKDFDQDWLNNAQAGAEWLFPAEDFIPAIPAVNVAIKHAPDHHIESLINGETMNPLFHFGTEYNQAKTVARSYWQGIHLKEGPNDLEFIVRDAAGQTVATFKRKVHFSGSPVRAELLQEYSYLVADGVTSPVLAIRLFDKWGNPVRPGILGQFIVSEPYFSKAFIEATKKNPLNALDQQNPQYEIGDYGITLLELEPTTQAGKVRLNFVFNKDFHQEIQAWLKPQQREWVVVGVADATLGQRNTSGSKSAALNANFEDDRYDEGKITLFAKGTLSDQWLVTASYDTRKDKQVVGNSLFQTIDPDTFFTLYGDKTEQYYEAASAEKLFAKIEREQFYTLFGDYNTGLNETELAKFNRSVTGLKSEYHGDRFSVNTFATSTTQRFVKDEIQGNGTSGLYRLSQTNMVINSEIITLETRDRFHSQDILNSRTLRRHYDYDIDYQAGTVFFREPVVSRDNAFNPNIIVIDYEVEAEVEGELTAGGRVAVSLLDKKLEIGVSAIRDGDFQVSGDLYATDLTLKMGDFSELKLEFAASDVDDANVQREGNAYLAEYKHLSEILEGRVYLREQEGSFGLGQQAGSESAMRKYGIDGAYRLSKNLRLNAELFHEDNLASGASRDVTEVDLGYQQSASVVVGGFRSAIDEDVNGNQYESELLLLGAAQGFYQNKLTLRFNNEIALNSQNENSAFPSRHILGIDYLLKPNINFYAEHEITEGVFQDSNTSRVGVRSSPWSHAQINTSLEEQVNEFGPRLFSTLGLTQGFQMSEHWGADVSLDRVDTIRHPGDLPFNLNVPPTSGTFNNDYIAVSLSANYRSEKSAFVGRAETRDADTEDKNGYYLGWYRDDAEGVGYSLKTQIFDTVYRTGDARETTDVRFSLSYRPVSSQWIHLNRLDFKRDNQIDAAGLETRSRKIINNWKGNYMLNRSNQIAVSYGIKYVLDSFDGDEYSGLTQLLGSEYRHDMSKRWDIGVHGSLLRSQNTGNYRYALGIDSGWTLVDNLWLSVGYNFDGFDDPDFSLANYTAKGLYVKLRMKFDQHSFHDIFNRQPQD